MQYDFLKDFTRRMKCVGLYALLYDNSSQKYIWKERGFNTLDEQLNVIFSVMLYIMEQSLKEESCTIDNITVFLDSLNEKYYKKSMSYDECSDLAKFIVNVVLSNEGCFHTPAATRHLRTPRNNPERCSWGHARNQSGKHHR